MAADPIVTIYSGDYTRCLQHCSADRSRPVVIYGELGSEALSPFINEDFGAYTILRHYVQVSLGAGSERGSKGGS